MKKDFDRGARLWLSAPPMKNMALQFSSPSLSDVMQFRFVARTQLPDKLNWFHQCDNTSYQMFEFWSDNQSDMLEVAIQIAGHLGLDLHTETPNAEYWRQLHEAHPALSRQVSEEDVFAFLDEMQRSSDELPSNRTSKPRNQRTIET